MAKPNLCLECGGKVAPWGRFKDGNAPYCWECITRIVNGKVTRQRREIMTTSTMAAAILLMATLVSMALAAMGGCVWVWLQVFGG